jgi:hypothetical protein
MPVPAHTFLLDRHRRGRICMETSGGAILESPPRCGVRLGARDRRVCAVQTGDLRCEVHERLGSPQFGRGPVP